MEEACTKETQKDPWIAVAEGAVAKGTECLVRKESSTGQMLREDGKEMKTLVLLSLETWSSELLRKGV